MVLDIVTYPNPQLGQKSQKAVPGKELDGLVQNMLDTVNSFKDPEAAGLSAIQVGIPVRVLIARDFSVLQADGENNRQDSLSNDIQLNQSITGSKNVNNKKLSANQNRDYILVNPKFVSLSKEEELDWEGCLSFPDLYGKVWRAKKVKLKYQNLQGDEQRLTASGFLARVIQHEMDHLGGITFNTRIMGKMYKGDELEKGTKIAD